MIEISVKIENEDFCEFIKVTEAALSAIFPNGFENEKYSGADLVSVVFNSDGTMDVKLALYPS
jgi:hypothetical protein